MNGYHRPSLSRQTCAALVALFAWALLGSPLCAQDFSILQATLDAQNRPHIEFPGDSNAYYVLHRGSAPESISEPVALVLGAAGLMEFTGSAISPAPAQVYFRIQRVPQAQPLDQDGDGIDDVWELTRSGLLNPLNPADASTDPDGNGLTYLQEFQAATLALTTIAEISPANGEEGVAVTRETILYFSNPLHQTTLLNTNNLYAEAAGRRVLSRIELASDRRKVTLFYQEPIPASARVRVTFDGMGVKDYLGRVLDADGDGNSGGWKITEFDTLSITPNLGTAVVGYVYASELQPGEGNTNSVDIPLSGVVISLDRDEQNVRATTDATGFFRLEPVPSGRFFVHVDGRYALGSQWPAGDYYPIVGKAWDAVAGQTDNLPNPSAVIYLPLVKAGTLQQVNATETTIVSFPPSVLQENPQLAGVSIAVPPNALFDDTGARGAFWA